MQIETSLQKFLVFMATPTYHYNGYVSPVWAIYLDKTQDIQCHGWTTQI